MNQDLNFAWLEEGRIAGCRGPQNPADLEALARLGVGALVRLVPESAVSSQQVIDAGLTDLYEPIEDFKAPSLDQVERVLSFIGNELGQDRPVAVSCRAGIGRTGTLLACFLVSSGLTSHAALDKLAAINKRPEADEQVAAIREFEARLASKAGSEETER